MASSTVDAASIADCEIVKPDRSVNEFSSVENLKYIGPHFTDRCNEVCGTVTLGGVLEHFSGKDDAFVVRDVYRICRNLRAGEECQNGVCVRRHNAHAAMTLFRLLACGRRHPELFSKHKVHIAVTSAELSKMYRVEETSTPPRQPRLTKKAKEEQRRRLFKAVQERKAEKKR